MLRGLTILIILTAAIAAVIIPVAAGCDMKADKTLSPYFFIENGDPAVDRFPLKSTHVDVSISGVIALVRIVQTYENTGTRPIHARYVFPSSTRAAVHGMKMTIGHTVIRAKIEERDTAQKHFDQAKQAGKTASLLKQQRPNVFSMNVANVLPQDRIEIELQYSELLVPTDGIYEFVYPTVVGPRFSEQADHDAPDTEKWIKNPYMKENKETPSRFDIALNIAAGVPLRDISCSTHDTGLEWRNDSSVKMTLSESEQSGGDRDFILNYRLSGNQIESGMLLYQGQDENFFLLMAQPPQRIEPRDIPPREYIFVLDVSGSMHGFPLNTAKRLLVNLIGNLRPTDRFNVILFAGGASVMAPSSVPATPENINQAVTVIDSQKGGGGTRLHAALKKGLGLPGLDGFSRTMIIVTDGYISAEKAVFRLIADNLDRANVFSFGIGSGVNRYLIEGMARAGRGEPFVVTAPGEARRTADNFRKYIEAPVLTDIKVDYDGFDAYDIEPLGVPDLFAGRPVIVFGKWRGHAHGLIRITGTGGSGEYVKTMDVSHVMPRESNQALRYLWARERTARLSDYNVRKINTDNREAITHLGLTYNLLTAYTSFIAIHEQVRNTGGTAEQVNQPLPLPKNVSNFAVGHSGNSVPEPGMVLLLVVAGLLIMACSIKKVLCGA